MGASETLKGWETLTRIKTVIIYADNIKGWYKELDIALLSCFETRWNIFSGV